MNSKFMVVLDPIARVDVRPQGKPTCSNLYRWNGGKVRRADNDNSKISDVNARRAPKFAQGDVLRPSVRAVSNVADSEIQASTDARACPLLPTYYGQPCVVLVYG